MHMRRGFADKQIVRDKGIEIGICFGWDHVAQHYNRIPGICILVLVRGMTL